MAKVAKSIWIREALLSAAIALAGVVLSGNVDARAQQFSADIVVEREGGRTPAGRVFVLEGKTRIETPELADGFFLVDRARQTAYFVRRSGRVYMDARQSSPLTRLLVPVDPVYPCRQWQAMADLAPVAVVVEHDGHEHAERDQAEAEHVALAAAEHRPPRRQAVEQTLRATSSAAP